MYEDFDPEELARFEKKFRDRSKKDWGWSESDSKSVRGTRKRRVSNVMYKPTPLTDEDREWYNQSYNNEVSRNLDVVPFKEQQQSTQDTFVKKDSAAEEASLQQTGGFPINSFIFVAVAVERWWLVRCVARNSLLVSCLSLYYLPR